MRRFISSDIKFKVNSLNLLGAKLAPDFVILISAGLESVIWSIKVVRLYTF